MNEIRIDRKEELFWELCNKYPNYKHQIIRKVINHFDCDITKIDEHLRKSSMDDSANPSSHSSMRHSSEGNVFSFASLNSDNSGFSSPGQNSKSYRSSNELSKISLQKTELQKLDDAFKQLEKHRDFLNRETLYLGEVIQRRKSIVDFPTANEVDSLDIKVNRKYSMPIKSISYANDLRQPSEMNRRYAGFHGDYNPYPVTNNDDNNNNHHPSDQTQQPNLSRYLIRDQLNPNLFHSPQQINDYLAPFKKLNEKRYSAHIDQAIEIPQEFTGHSPFRAGHTRQRSDPWVLERPLLWDCPQCYVKNSSAHCSFCEYDPNSRP